MYFFNVIRLFKQLLTLGAVRITEHFISDPTK